MKYLLSFFALTLSLHAAENPYEKINNRNAFDLTGEKPAPILPPVSAILPPNVFLTGITKWNGVRKIHLVLKKTGEPDRFVSLRTNEKQYDIELKKILNDAVLISSGGTNQVLSFENNRLPTVITKKPTPKSTSSSRSSGSKKEEKKSSPQPPRPQVVTVPSRSRRATDPRMQQMLEKGLEYVSKMEDPEKRNAILERIEKYQNGEHSSRNSDDRKKRYEEYRRRREK